MCVSAEASACLPLSSLTSVRADSSASVCLPAVLFNMHDTDNDGMITLEEYRHVSLYARWS